jgi:hypothetical protein
MQFSMMLVYQLCEYCIAVYVQQHLKANYKKKRMEEFTGFLAAVGSVLFFGSYAVPIRLPSVMAAKIDPVIFQFYKSFACFSTSWLVLLYMVWPWCVLS